MVQVAVLVKLQYNSASQLSVVWASRKVCSLLGYLVQNATVSLGVKCAAYKPSRTLCGVLLLSLWKEMEKVIMCPLFGSNVLVYHELLNYCKCHWCGTSFNLGKVYSLWSTCVLLNSPIYCYFFNIPNDSTTSSIKCTSVMFQAWSGSLGLFGLCYDRRQ